MKENESFNIDAALERLEVINQKLSEKDITLEESLNLYNEGSALAKQCQENLVGVEKQLQIINGGE